jgi:hypothetical protein
MKKKKKKKRGREREREGQFVADRDNSSNVNCRTKIPRDISRDIYIFFAVCQNILLLPRFRTEPLTMFCRRAKYSGTLVR